MKNLLSIVFLFLVVGSFIACGGETDQSDANTDATETSAEDGPEFASLYICPMHCAGSGGEAAGVCPSCGMDYVMNETHPDYVAPEHSHEGHDHEGHDHGDHNH